MNVFLFIVYNISIHICIYNCLSLIIESDILPIKCYCFFIFTAVIKRMKPASVNLHNVQKKNLSLVIVPSYVAAAPLKDVPWALVAERHFLGSG